MSLGIFSKDDQRNGALRFWKSRRGRTNDWQRENVFVMSTSCRLNNRRSSVISSIFSNQFEPPPSSQGTPAAAPGSQTNSRD